MSDEYIDSLLVKLGIAVDQASFTNGTKAVNGLDNAINRAARERGKNGVDQFGKNMATVGQNAKGLEQYVDKFDKTVGRTPRSLGVLQSRLGSATQQMAGFRKETQAAVALLSRGASATGMGPLAGGMFSMMAGGGPLAMAAAGIGGLITNASMFSGRVLETNNNAQDLNVSMADVNNLNSYGKSIVGNDGVGTQLLAAAKKIQLGASHGEMPLGEALFGAVPGDFAGSQSKKPLEVLDIIQRQLRSTNDPLKRQGIGSSLGLDMNAVRVVTGDYRAGMEKYNVPGSNPNNDDVKAAQEHAAAMALLGKEFDKLTNSLGREVLPSLTGFVDRVNGMFSKGGLVDKASDFAQKLKDGDVKGAVGILKESDVPGAKLALDTYNTAAKGDIIGAYAGAYKRVVGGYYGTVVDHVPGFVKNLAGKGYDAVSGGVKGYLGAHDDRIKNLWMLSQDPLAKKYRETPNGRLSLAMMQAESAGNNSAVSGKHAFGISQVMPGTAADPGFGLSPLSANATREQRAKHGSDYLMAMIKRYGDTDKGLAAYNWGPGNLDKDLRANKDAWHDHLPSETSGYLATVHRNMEILDSALPRLRPLVRHSDGAMLPGGAPETYNMVANPPAPLSITPAQNQQSAPEGHTIHIDARGSTDPHQVTSEAIKALNQQLQGQLTITQSHYSMDLDQ